MTKTALRRIDLVEVSISLLADAPSPYWAPDEALYFAAQYGRTWFTKELALALQGLQLAKGPAALHLTNAPTLPTTVRTPDLIYPVEKEEEWTNEACLLSLATFLGCPYGYAREHEGAIIQQVVPVPSKEGVASSEGAGELGFHTENSFASTRPDFVLLLCRRPGPKSVPTYVLDANEITSLLEADTVKLLCQPIYDVASPASFGEPGIRSKGVCVLEATGNRVALRLDLDDLLTSRSSEGKEALDELFSVLPAAGVPVYMEAGDVLMIDNRRAAHMRPAFTVIFDGQHRWLQRCLVRSEFWTCRASLEDEGVVVL